MKCFVCQAELNGSTKLLRHFRLVHGLVPAKHLHLKCVESGCASVFGTFSVFRKHLHTKHAEQNVSEQNFDTIDSQETVKADGQSYAEILDLIGHNI